jgi:hypothetical protein
VGSCADDHSEREWRRHRGIGNPLSSYELHYKISQVGGFPSRATNTVMKAAVGETRVAIVTATTGMGIPALMGGD